MTQRCKSLMTEGPAPFTLDPSGGRRFALPTRGSGTVKLGAAGSDGAVSAFDLLGRLDVLIQAEDVLWIVLLLDRREPIEVHAVRGANPVLPL